MCVLHRLTGLVLLALLTMVGCDVTQPLQVDEQLAAVEFAGPTSTGNVRTYNVWTMYEDSDADGLPDDQTGDGVGDLYPWCEILTNSSLWLPPTSTPWGHSLEITIIRGADNSNERVSNNAALQVDGNRTAYDSSVSMALLPPKSPITVNDGGTTRTFYFDNNANFGAPRRRLTAMNEEVASGTSNPLSDIEGPDGTYGHERGLCSRYYPGPATIGGGPALFETVIKKSDTITVNARRGNGNGTQLMVYRDSAGILQPIIPPNAGPTISAEFAVGGRPITSVSGNTSAGDVFGDSISFSYTSR